MHDVLWTEQAVRDLDEIGAYIAIDSPKSAEKVVRRIAEHVARIAYFPRQGRQGKGDATRELPVTGTPYVIVYRVGEPLQIITIFHAARKWPEVF